MKPRGLRNNNPGNIRNSDATDWKGEVNLSDKKDNAFEEFETMAHGYRALIKLLQNYRQYHRCLTISDFINRWAPRTENNTSAYIHTVCRHMGMKPNDIPDVNDKRTMIEFASAISLVENGVSAIRSEVEAGWEML